MRESLRISFASAVVILSAGCIAPSFAADIELTRLNACADVGSVLQRLRKGSGPLDDDCRQPANAVERGVAKAFAPIGQKTCFLRSAPLPALSDFGCLRTSASEQEGITCMRPAPLSLVSDYKDGYRTKYASSVNNYLKQAAACPGSNGDAAIAPSTTFSPFLLPVASFELSFVSQYGTTRPGNAAIYHGFARTSPDASRTGIEAIEFVTYNWRPENSASEDALAYTKFGNWRLRLDDSDEFVEALNKFGRKHGASFVGSMFDVTIKRSADASSVSTSSSVSDEVARKAISDFEDEGFEAMSESDLRKHTGMDSTGMLEKVAEQMPYGSQRLAKRFMANSRVTVLMRTNGHTCTRNGQGAFGAYVLRNDGEPNVKTDFGSVTLFVLGFGACGRSLTANKSYVRELVSDAKETILAELKSR